MAINTPQLRNDTLMVTVACGWEDMHACRHRKAGIGEYGRQD